jgi:methionyl-tRNA formyltransferase
MRLVMMGTGTFAEPTFRALLAGPHEVVGLVTQPDRHVGHERGSTRQVGASMKSIALEHCVPVFQPESVNTPEGVAGLREMAPDLLVVAAYGQILSKEVLAVPPQGGINVHASLLPKYRGAAPVAWAIYHGETETGITIIRMSVHLDAGDILLQEAVQIGADETAGELEARLAVVGARLATAALDQLAKGTVKGVKQDQTRATKAPKLKKEHGLIDWTRTAEQVCNQIRAMQPWPTAYTFLHQKTRPPVRISVTKATVGHVPQTDITASGPRPGDACSLRMREPIGDVLVVETGSPDHVVRILELQLAGKRRMPAAEFLRGHKIQSGDRFGSERP